MKSNFSYYRRSLCNAIVSFISNIQILRNLLFWHVRINCAKSYCSRHLLSVNWCPTLIRFVLFSSNVHTQSLLQLRLIDFSRGFFVWVQNCTKVAIFCNFVLDRSDLWRFAIKSWSEISLSSYNDEKKSFKDFGFNIFFNNKKLFFSC